MKKNVYLTVLAIVTTICILFGSALHIIGFGPNVFDRWFSSEKWDHRSGKNSIIFIEPTQLTAFDQISVDAAAMDLTLRSGSTYEISYRCNRKMKPEYKVENDTLHLTQNEDTATRTGSSNRCEVVITIPSDTILSGILVDLDLGDINFDRLQTASLNLAARLGDVDLKNCELGNVVIAANLGDVDLSSCTFDKFDAALDMGDLTVESSSDLSGRAIDATVDMGSLKINGKKYLNHFSQKGAGTKIITLENHMGDIELEY